MTAPDKPRLSIRIDLPGGGRFGPGKAALLDAIADLGSINKAAAQLGMSYPRAKKLVEAMNRDFGVPLVISAQGGADGGGSRLTDAAEEIRGSYRELCKRAFAHNKELLKTFSKPDKRN
ncbi:MULTISPECIES: winged helix-turn-helix domain-containing protein [Hyphomonas]|uniref:LysR family transcriptional regulator n=1 Tax=Hyphomonas adhaerens TaxID=81029 RepID=A0A3B9GYC8_9PROT|nr:MULTISPECIES: LysR family transcriptional regulator [Hyphomonas]MBB40377.1 LysR family transcriptional regulator [Hyphomonas sp.]HAE27216.1 LysR family transcriptional regulator [Hyphomonas adhaerens]|tara:strand:+ start:573 stop:929 length:357 start_codon:yes stop_codon:yes gene_type:complete